MIRRFAIEWLWLMGCCVAAGAWVRFTGSEADPIGVIFGAIWLGSVGYAAAGIVRLTVVAIRVVSKS
jgi:hypothetical protein